jgi:hypothetical protein
MEETMTAERKSLPPFNTPLETGLRSVGVLAAAYPSGFDLQRLVAFDYLVVHTGDIDGPPSLHPDLPMRSAELLVRRGLVERGHLLMVSRGLVNRQPTLDGITYYAGEIAETFLASLESRYLGELQERARWVVENFGTMQEDIFRSTMSKAVDQWVEQFQVTHRSLAGEP